jgi:L,D-transpeptidase-like protein/putative peptidoglycan binding protein
MRGRRVAAGMAVATMALAVVASASAATSVLPASTGPLPAAAPPPPKLGAGVIAPGVSIDGVAVGGLTRVPATEAVLRQRVVPKRRPLVLTFRGRRVGIDPVRAGYRADVAYAVKVALLYGHKRPAQRIDIPLRETVNRAKVRAILAQRAEKLDIAARDASLSFKGDVPVVRAPRLGIAVDRKKAASLVARALLSRSASTYALPATRTAPSVTSIGTVLVINRETLQLKLYRGSKRLQTYPVATGMAAYPTPTGLFSIIQKQVDPTWTPPDSRWAAGLGPVPPGVGNPLGTRWMGISAPGIGIHGTPVPSSVGTHASHGCIRMYIHDAENLFGRIEVGTPVLIV